ncbi:ATP-binding cassette domain-containing protein [Shimia sp. R9_3]|uniref:ATP-binding cassette domain-containing protein n=1 Tax=Shimia sp. R9_3 TaxID=2821113 RepID=UPI001ADCAD9C|nr:ATP-binding cassette domain-containing protein [Shimia sp. R9_3]MBO9401807.1 ATP-binding cassette domain-containing protein [Shimia sp. R9_3]
MSDAPKKVHDFLVALLAGLGRAISKPVALSACHGYRISEDLDDLAEVVSLLGLSASVVQKLPAGWRDCRDGALVCLRDGELYAQLRTDGLLENVSTVGEAEHYVLKPNERVLHIEAVTAKNAAAITYLSLAARARRVVQHGIWQSLAINLCALTVPFFTMAVYDRVLGGAAVSSLPALLSGAVLVLGILLVLRRIRASMLASEHARFGATVSNAVAHRMFRQPYLMQNKLDAETAVAKLRQCERTADLFASKNTVAIYDAPFILLTLIALVVVGGGLAVIPAIYLVLFLLLGVLLGWTQATSDPIQADLTKRHKAMLSDLPFANSVRTRGVSKQWMARFDQLSRASARVTHAAHQKPALVHSVGNALGSGTALATLVVGLDLALRGLISPGTLIGTMLLTWRITGPAQGVFLAIPRLRALKDAWRQLKSTLDLQVIHAVSHAQDNAPEAPVDIKAEGLFVRYAAGADPALTGASFEIPAGIVVAVIGPNGSGKSTLLRVLSGALATQSGRLMLGGRSISHFNPDSLSEQFVFLPSDPRQNPDVPPAFKDAMTLDQVAAEDAAWSAATARKAPVYLLDDPLSVAGDDARAQLADFMARKRGAATVVIATHDAALVPLADMAIVLDRGTLVYAGPIQQQGNLDAPLSDVAEETTP